MLRYGISKKSVGEGRTVIFVHGQEIDYELKKITQKGRAAAKRRVLLMDVVNKKGF